MVKGCSTTMGTAASTYSLSERHACTQEVYRTAVAKSDWLIDSTGLMLDDRLSNIRFLSCIKKCSPPIGYETDLGREKGTEGAEMCVVKTTTKPGSRLICFCHSSVQKKSALILYYNNNITKVLHTFLCSGGMFTK